MEAGAQEKEKKQKAKEWEKKKEWVERTKEIASQCVCEGQGRAEQSMERERESKKVKHLIIHDNIVSGMKIVASECVQFSGICEVLKSYVHRTSHNKIILHIYL